MKWSANNDSDLLLNFYLRVYRLHEENNFRQIAFVHIKLVRNSS